MTASTCTGPARPRRGRFALHLGVLGLLGLGCLATASAQVAEIRDHYAVTGVKTTFNVEFGKVQSQPLACDLFLPAIRADDRPLPLIIFVHGGAWMTGLRIDIPRELIAFAARGYAVATIDYRPSRFDRYPANVHDVRAAVRYLRAHAAEHAIDPDRIALVGFASGGHLALLAGLAGPELEGSVGDHDEVSSAVQAVVSFHGPTNIQTILTQPTPGGVGRHRPAVELMLGGPPEKLAALARQASPVTHIRRDGPPVLLVHGDADDQIPLAQSREFEAACRRRGAPVECVVLEGHSHRHLRSFDPSRTAPLETFLRRTLQAAEPPASGE